MDLDPVCNCTSDRGLELGENLVVQPLLGRGGGLSSCLQEPVVHFRESFPCFWLIAFPILFPRKNTICLESSTFDSENEERLKAGAGGGKRGVAVV